MTDIDWTEHGKEWAITGYVARGCLSPAGIWGQLKDKIHIVEGGLEHATTTNMEHWQMCIQLKKTIYRRQMNELFQPGVYRTAVQYEHSWFGAQQQYCKKEGGQWESFGTYVPTQVKKKAENKAARKRLFNDVYDGMDYEDCWENHRETMPHYWRAVQEAIRVYHPDVTTGSFDLDDFTREPITDWSKSIILHGQAGIGKTQYALAHFKSPLLVSDKNDLGQFNKKKHDGIVFDDMNFNDWSREEQLHIVEQEVPKSIRILYGTKRIPAHTKKIFTTNMQNIFIIGDGAIDRRCRWVMNLEDLRQTN